MSDLGENIQHTAQKAREAAELARKATRTEKEAVIDRIRARRDRLSHVKAIADAETALADLDRRTAREGAARDPLAPVEPRVLPRRDRAVGISDEFPHSATLKLALQHPAVLALGVGLVWKLGPAKLLVVGRLLLPLLRKP